MERESTDQMDPYIHKYIAQGTKQCKYRPVKLFFFKSGKMTRFDCSEWPPFPSPLGRWSKKQSTPILDCFFRCFLLILWIHHGILGPWTFWMFVFEQMQNTHLGQCYLWNQLFVFKKKRICGNALQTGRKLGFFPRKKKSTLAFLLYKTFCISAKKHQFGPVLPLKVIFFLRFGFEKRVLWPRNYSNKHPFSTNKHTFHGNVSFLVKRFRFTKFFRPKKQELGFAPTNSWKHGKSSVRFRFGAAPLVLISVFENVNLKSCP